MHGRSKVRDIPNRSDWLRRLYSTLEKGGLGLIRYLIKARSLNGLLSISRHLLSELKGSEGEAMDAVSEILAFVKRTKQFYIQRILENDNVRHRIKK